MDILLVDIYSWIFTIVIFLIGTLISSSLTTIYGRTKVLFDKV
jgi:hypothetical protein